MDISAKIPGYNITYGEYAAFRMRQRVGGGAGPEALHDGNTVAWFDKDVNVIKDGSNFVSAWGDRSGNGNDLLQSTGTNQPLWSGDGVLFDGVDNFMKCVPFTLIQPEFLYLVLKQVSWFDADRFIDGHLTATGILQQITSTPNFRAFAGSGSSESSDLPLGTYGIIRVLFNGASSTLQINETTQITGDFGASNMGGFTLGGNASGGANFGNIQVKEVIIRKIADTAPNEQIIYNYLASKYSIS